MTDLAFAHPEERAKAMAGADPVDRISLRDHVVQADIGAFQQERGRQQRLRFNVVVEVAPNGPAGDDVDRILSYDRISEAIAAELAAERLNLLETLAERIATRVLAEPQALRIFLRIEKLDVGPYALGVEIVRSRENVETVVGDAVHPLIAHLDNAAIASQDLPFIIDGILAQGMPVILTVGLPDFPRAVTGHKPTQRRVDLLAMEQNAWALAARDARCVVVGTRTELDWAIRRGRMVVWAPSKMVLDAVDGPVGADPVLLVLWLAGVMQATVVQVHGDVAIPADACVPVMRLPLAGAPSKA
ncbi:MAG: dihydroneopterin aldolase [Rhodobacteraceae bacterium]|nr:dihydroneopterin aldolase [Paracoccaceae bacterium]